MIHSSRTIPGSSTGPLELNDPTGIYEFEVVVEAVPDANRREPRCQHKIHATRTYDTVNDISAVWPANLGVANLIQQMIQMRVVDQANGQEIKGHGVDITVVLNPDITGHYSPVDILIGNRSINQHHVTPGFWKVDHHLQRIIDHQSKGLMHDQIVYTGRKSGVR